MNEQQILAIYGIIIDVLVMCDECGDQDGLLSMTMTPDGVMRCQDCNTSEGFNGPTVEILIRAETKINSLREAFAMKDN